MRLLLVLIPLLFLAGCSTTVKGPVTKRTYEINVGCTDDMKRYSEERQEVVGDKVEVKESFECPPAVPVEGAETESPKE